MYNFTIKCLHNNISTYVLYTFTQKLGFQIKKKIKILFNLYLYEYPGIVMTSGPVTRRPRITSSTVFLGWKYLDCWF